MSFPCPHPVGYTEPPPRCPVEPQAPYQSGQLCSLKPGPDSLPHVQVIAPWRMPEFYNRFQGRNDLMEYAKVWPEPTITLALAQCPPGTALQGGCLGQRHGAGTDTHAWKLNLCPGCYPPPRYTCSLGRLR